MYDVGNAGPGLGRAHKCGGVEQLSSNIDLYGIQTIFGKFPSSYSKHVCDVGDTILSFLKVIYCIIKYNVFLIIPPLFSLFYLHSLQIVLSHTCNILSFNFLIKFLTPRQNIA